MVIVVCFTGGPLQIRNRPCTGLGRAQDGEKGKGAKDRDKVVAFGPCHHLSGIHNLLDLELGAGRSRQAIDMVGEIEDLGGVPG